MFDHLDDPNPPEGGPDARAAVARRVASRRRRRQIRWITGITIVVILGLAVGLPLGLRSGNNGSTQTAKRTSQAQVSPNSAESARSFSAVLDLQFATADNGWAFGKTATGQFGLAATSDGGKTWRSATLPNDAHPMSVRPNRDGSVVIVFSADRAYVSHDGGASWTPETGLTGNIVDMSAFGSSMWALVSQCPAGSPSCRPILWISSDAGRTWHIPDAQPVMGNRDGQLVQSGPGGGWVVSLDTSGTQREPVVSWAIDKGASWYSTAGNVSVPECLDVRIAGAFGTSLELLCNRADGSGWKLLRSDDAGHTWSLGSLPTAPRMTSLTTPSDQAPVYHCVDPSHCWAALPGPRGSPYIWRATDGGRSWSSTPLP